MRRVWRGAAPLLAAALGLARTAAAQPPQPAAPAPLPAAFAAADDDAPPAPRVVPHRRIVLEPMKEAPPSPAAARPTVDPLAPGALPPGWWSKGTRTQVAVVPSGLPGPAPAAAPATTPRPPAAASAVRTTTTTAAAHVWPAAFLVRSEPEPDEVKQAAHLEPSADATAEETPAVADVKRRIEALYGPKTADVSVEKDAEGDVVVRVRVRARDADLEKAKVLALLKAAGSGVRVLLELKP